VTKQNLHRLLVSSILRLGEKMSTTLLSRNMTGRVIETLTDLAEASQQQMLGFWHS